MNLTQQQQTWVMVKSITNKIKNIMAKHEKHVADHPIFSQLATMALGEEIVDGVWDIVRVPNGWIVKRLNMDTVFVPEN